VISLKIQNTLIIIGSLVSGPNHMTFNLWHNLFFIIYFAVIVIEIIEITSSLIHRRCDASIKPLLTLRFFRVFFREPRTEQRNRTWKSAISRSPTTDAQKLEPDPFMTMRLGCAQHPHPLPPGCCCWRHGSEPVSVSALPTTPVGVSGQSTPPAAVWTNIYLCAFYSAPSSCRASCSGVRRVLKSAGIHFDG